MPSHGPPQSAGSGYNHHYVNSVSSHLSTLGTLASEICISGITARIGGGSTHSCDTMCSPFVRIIPRHSHLSMVLEG